MARGDKHLQFRILFTALGILIGIMTICYQYDYKDIDSVMKHINDTAIKFSEETGVYSGPLTLKMQKDYQLPANAVIYYTLDGNDPDENSMVYNEPIVLKTASDEISVYPVKARVYYKGSFSGIIEHTYVLKQNISEEFNLNLISLTCDSDKLYDPVNGIFTNIGLVGEEGIRDAHLTMFQKSGYVSMEQSVGINIAGGTSRGMELKSFKITADEIYDIDNPKLNYNYSGNDLISQWSFVNEYNSMKFKSGAQDMFQGNIRSAVVSRLANASGFGGCTDTDRAALYLNGAFYGIYDIQQQYSNSFLANKFNLDITDAIVKHKGSEKSCFEDAGIMEYFMADLSVEENKVKLEQNVDMKEYLLYNAIEILINNADWPQNNYQIWRYTGENDETNPYSDGRWRFLIYDTDITYYSPENINFFEGITNDTFVSLMEGIYRAKESVFSNVMRNEDYRNRFTMIICDLLNTSFKTENVLSIISEEYEKIHQEMCLQYGIEYENEVSSTYIAWMKQQAEECEDEMHENLKKYFGLDSICDFTISTTKGIQVSWDYMNLYEQEEYSNTYYQNFDMEITHCVYPGYEFSHWVVNGEKKYEDKLKVSSESICDGKIAIHAVAKKIVDETIIIAELSAQSDSDWIKLYNAGENPVDLSQYYISDDERQLKKYQLPKILLQSGKYIIVNGKNNYYAIGEYICNFNLNKYDTIHLYDSLSNKVKDKVNVPRMEDNETYGRYENSNCFVFFQNIDGQRKKEK